MNSTDPFTLKFGNGMISVSEHLLTNMNLFRVVFSDNRKPLNLVRALNNNGSCFWTSVPEGRQNEADQIGPLIFEKLNEVK